MPLAGAMVKEGSRPCILRRAARSAARSGV